MNNPKANGLKKQMSMVPQDPRVSLESQEIEDNQGRWDPQEIRECLVFLETQVNIIFFIPDEKFSLRN